jgi:hypothetical protein
MRALWGLFGCFSIIWLSGCGSPAGLSEREDAAANLARHIAAELGPRAVLVFSNPYTQGRGGAGEINEFDEAGLRGLRRGFGEAVRMVQVFPEIRPEAMRDPASVYVDSRSTTVLSFLVAEDAFEKAVKANPECTVVVSLIGLPVNLGAFPSWSKPGAPHFGLMLPDWRIIGDQNAAIAAFSSGKLAGAVVQHVEKPPGQQYELVTRHNIASLAAAKPQLFSY